MVRAGGMRRSRCDENAAIRAEEEGVKRPKSDVPAPAPAQLPKESRKSKKGRKKKVRGGSKAQGSSSVLHPLNVNGLPVEQSVEHLAGETNNEDEQSIDVVNPVDNAEESSASSYAHSPETAGVDRTVIWSNAAFCSDQAPTGNSPEKAAHKPKGAVTNEVTQLSPVKEVDKKVVLRDACNTQPAKEEGNATEKRGSIVRFQEEPEKQVKLVDKVREEKVTGEDEELEEAIEKEIEKEIEILTKRLAELRARREAKDKIQERAKRALSCPPTPMTPKPEGTVADGDKSKCRKGRIISAKFLQWQNKSPIETEPKTADKQSRLRKPEFTVTPVQGRAPLPARMDVRDSLQKSFQKQETTPRVPVKNKVIEKLQAGAGILQGYPRKGEARGSLDGGFIDQMRNLSLSPASNASSDSYKKLDWTRSLRQSTVGKKTLPAENADTSSKQASANGSAEAQLLVDLKETKASKVSPAVTRKVRAVPSRYNNVESPVQLSSRKRSLDGSSQASESGGVSTHRKRASLGQAPDVYSPGVSHVRKSGIGLPRPGGQVNRSKSNVSSQAKAPAPTVCAGDVPKTPVASVKKDRDGLLESERKKLPGLLINKVYSDSPRDSGCVKRVSQQILEKKEPYFRL